MTKNDKKQKESRQTQEKDDDNYTTVMLRNIPNKYTREMLVKELRVQGFTGKYDFLYIPTDFANDANPGYGFINFRTNAARSMFEQKFNGQSVQDVLPVFKSSKVCEVTRAKHQGLQENVDRLMTSPELMARLAVRQDCTPLMFDEDGNLINFETPPVKTEEEIKGEKPASAGKTRQRKKGRIGEKKNGNNQNQGKNGTKEPKTTPTNSKKKSSFSSSIMDIDSIKAFVPAQQQQSSYTSSPIVKNEGTDSSFSTSTPVPTDWVNFSLEDHATGGELFPTLSTSTPVPTMAMEMLSNYYYDPRAEGEDGYGANDSYDPLLCDQTTAMQAAAAGDAYYGASTVSAYDDSLIPPPSVNEKVLFAAQMLFNEKMWYQDLTNNNNDINNNSNTNTTGLMNAALHGGLFSLDMNTKTTNSTTKSSTSMKVSGKRRSSKTQASSKSNQSKLSSNTTTNTISTTDTHNSSFGIASMMPPSSTQKKRSSNGGSSKVISHTVHVYPNESVAEDEERLESERERLQERIRAFMSGNATTTTTTMKTPKKHEITQKKKTKTPPPSLSEMLAEEGTKFASKEEQLNTAYFQACQDWMSASNTASPYVFQLDPMLQVDPALQADVMGSGASPWGWNTYSEDPSWKPVWPEF